MNAKSKSINILIYTFLSFTALLQVFPFYYSFMNSLQPKALVREPYKLYFLPIEWHFENYLEAWRRSDLFVGFKNTLIVAIVFTAISAVIAMYVGYILAKKKFRGNKLIFTSLMATMIVPGEILLIPLFIICRTLHITNSLAGVIIPGLVSVFGIFIAKQFMESIPDSYIESAVIDGAGEMTIFARIIMPMSQGALATYCIMTFVNVWNDYLWPMIILTDSSKDTLQLCIKKVMTLTAQQTGLASSQYVSALQDACAISAVFPVIIVFFIFQKKFVEGIVLSGIK